MRTMLTALEQQVWDAWNALPDTTINPVHTIAAALQLAPEEVAFIVYPAEVFGPWTDGLEDIQ
jgi:hypothetical protein